ncbi:MAG: hypothetical protein ACOY8P_04320 [Thermodesulfobacteriota bacterium]
MALWHFEIEGDVVTMGGRTRRKLTKNGCNEPFKGRYWCPKRQWFQRESCPFATLQECDNFETQCGAI